jgi:beta-barrel assembly-enhancing protease
MRSFLALLLFTGSLSLSAQTDFMEYSTLQSKGTIPTDFSELTSEKIAEGMNENRSELGSAEAQREFLENTGYAIDELLHSGLVVYGDEVSNYVASVADKLLAGNPSLRSKLRFYTLKLNETNAFSTDQGIIFVTTGLIAQLSSEAQLAFILAHEISHYTEKHVVETFAWKKNNKYGNDWVGRMSVYSKDKEFSADLLAVDMYREAGYAKEEMLSTFDVLLYSYLPFDEVPIDLDYFSTDLMYLPPFLFPTKEYPIKADADEDDSESSHPNVNKRKEAVQAKINEITGTWGTTINALGEEVFMEIRNIARFETVRTDIMDANYGIAIYSIYVLEREFPTSIFLKRMKAQAWLGLYQYEIHGQSNETISKESDLEGASAAVHFMLRKLSREGMTTLALRSVVDIQKENSTDQEISSIYHFMLRKMGENGKFSITDYSSLTFNQFVDSMEILNAKLASDTAIVVVEEPTPPKKSKYDRIKTSSSPDVVVAGGVVDSLKFYMYGLSDLVSDSIFLKDLATYFTVVPASLPPPQEIEKNFLGMEKKKRRSSPYEELKIGSDNLIVVEPRAIDYTKVGIDHVKSERLETVFSEAIGESADLAGTQTHRIDKRNLNTDNYNERSTLTGFLTQLVEEDDIVPFPADYSALTQISDRYGTSDVMFTVVDHTFQPEISVYALLISAICYPTFPFTLSIYLPIQVMSGNQTNLTILIMDIKSGELKTGHVFRFHERLTKHNVGARMYSIFKHIATAQ